MQVEDGVAVSRDLLRVGLPVEHPERAPVALRAFRRELPGRESEEIRRDRFRFAEPHQRASVGRIAPRFRGVRQRFPALRNLEQQGPARLQIRLIETRERFVGARGDEDRVQEIVVPVERRVAGAEGDRDRVPALHQRRGR